MTEGYDVSTQIANVGDLLRKLNQLQSVQKDIESTLKEIIGSSEISFGAMNDKLVSVNPDDYTPFMGDILRKWQSNELTCDELFGTIEKYVDGLDMSNSTPEEI